MTTLLLSLPDAVEDGQRREAYREVFASALGFLRQRIAECGDSLNAEA